ncbi:hypothetical protein GGP91_001040 [Salinibacter ruber]|uniref:DUF4382 domain-containing protein n=1 Tax=Salinibacter ruber TaxID=146919 RepID=UPI0020738154|nr:DUF4382 domain-containing protein [Salinibacter ruber]MCS3630127.1 hypothetical protein [Salinibacter ruber]MCS3828981.1 hypothetical protein [Salinibacter ruber]MCS4056350.1 hypothetical protein [Salinibacter ruber]MCS4059649.1 hypothetical protein [Salinibacter ruber]MCS4161039.1 hypothetical protein [Salinibacter ruber]
MKRLSFVTLVALTTFGFLFATGCDSTGSVTDTEDGTLSLSMSDGSTTKSLRTHSGPNSAPDGITEALVTIDAVSVVPVEEEANEGDATEAGVSVLRDANFEVDLKELQTGLDTTLAELELPAGEYGQIRLVTANMASVTFQDGRQSDVMIASNSLKLDKFDPFTIASADDRVEVTLNWDVKEALKGNSQGRFVITPAIAATVDTSSVGQQ